MSEDRVVELERRCQGLYKELRATREAQQQADERYQVVCIGRDAIATRCAEAEAALASVRAALRDLLDAIPDETLKADPPLESWAQLAERALAASSAGTEGR